MLISWLLLPTGLPSRSTGKDKKIGEGTCELLICLYVLGKPLTFPTFLPRRIQMLLSIWVCRGSRRWSLVYAAKRT